MMVSPESTETSLKISPEQLTKIGIKVRGLDNVFHPYLDTLYNSINLSVELIFRYSDTEVVQLSAVYRRT